MEMSINARPQDLLTFLHAAPHYAQESRGTPVAALFYIGLMLLTW